MRIEPWKLMIGLAVLLIVIGALSATGTREPMEVIRLVTLIGVLIVLTFLGYKIGNHLGNRVN